MASAFLNGNLDLLRIEVTFNLYRIIFHAQFCGSLFTRLVERSRR
jgi:hypothetical protein